MSIVHEIIFTFQPFALTCTLAAGTSGYDLTTTTGETARTCTVTGSFTGSPLTLTVPAGMTSVTSDPLFESGTTVMVKADIDAANGLELDSAAADVTITEDTTETKTLTQVSFYLSEYEVGASSPRY